MKTRSKKPLVEFGVPIFGPWIHDSALYLLLRDLLDEVLKKKKLFEKTAESA
jgi:hypothetical protein